MKCPGERGGQIPPLSRWRRYPSGVFTRWMLLLAVALLAPPGPGAGRAADAVPGLDEVPLSQLLEIVVAGRDLLAFDARAGGQITERLRLDERVLWQGSRGQVGAVLTDQRILAVGVGSSSWQGVEVQREEMPPEQALLGDRLLMVVTNRRVIGFAGEPGNLSEQALGLAEEVLARRVGENVAVLVTDRRALGLSSFQGGFAERKLQLKERVESVSAAANLATLRSDRRILIFRSPTRSWEERRLDLN